MCDVLAEAEGLQGGIALRKKWNNGVLVMAKMKYNTVELGRVVSRDPEIHSGDLVFSGTRVPVDTLIDYLKGGHAIGEFLKDFPTVARWQVESYLEVSPKGLDHLEERINVKKKRPHSL